MTAELAAVVRAQGSRTPAADLLIEIAPIMSELGAADCAAGWYFLADEDDDYGKFHTIFREVEHLDEEL
ncbi:MAG: hypothetical protein IH987_18295 [Planctomycetes bacterium]|nr:hypothetical protein [Planctomycetota bacterium]